MCFFLSKFWFHVYFLTTFSVIAVIFFFNFSQFLVKNIFNHLLLVRCKFAKVSSHYKFTPPVCGQDKHMWSVNVRYFFFIYIKILSNTGICFEVEHGYVDLLYITFSMFLAPCDYQTYWRSKSWTGITKWLMNPCLVRCSLDRCYSDWWTCPCQV